MFFFRTTGPILTKRGTKHSFVKRITICSNEGPHPFLRVNYYEITKLHCWNLINLLVQNHRANFNQTWHKVFLGEGDSSLFKWRTMLFPVEISILTKLPSLNIWINFNQTLHIASKGEGNSTFYNVLQIRPFNSKKKKKRDNDF